MDQRAERGEATRRHLLAVATRLFTERGYEPVSIEAILAETGMSRGSLYHHFPGKEALFTAVLEATEARIAAAVVQAAEGVVDPVGRLRAGCLAWLDLAASDAAVRQIALIDGPSVLGWQKWREMDARYALGLLKAGLAAVATAGGIRKKRSICSPTPCSASWANWRSSSRGLPTRRLKMRARPSRTSCIVFWRRRKGRHDIAGPDAYPPSPSSLNTPISREMFFNSLNWTGSKRKSVSP